MSQYNIAETKAKRSELARRALAGEEIISARNNHPLISIIAQNTNLLVRLVSMQLLKRARCPGSGTGQLLSMALDFDEACLQ